MTKTISILLVAFSLICATDTVCQERRRGIEGDVGLQIATAKPMANVFPLTWGFGLGPRWGFATADRLWIKLNFGITRGGHALDGDSYTETLMNLRSGPEWQYEAWRSDAVTMLPFYRLDFSYTFDSERTGGVFDGWFNEENEHLSNFFSGGGMAQTVGLKALFDDTFFIYAGYTFYHPLLRNRNPDYQGDLGAGWEDVAVRRFNMSTMSVGIGVVADFWND